MRWLLGGLIVAGLAWGAWLVEDPLLTRRIR
jgi:hypothetical protein